MKQINSGFQSGVCLRQSPKKHTVGLDKAISPSETIHNIFV